MLEKMREVRVRIGSVEQAHELEYASPSCWCSCSRGTCVAGELVVGDVPVHPIPVDDRQETSSRCPYSVHSFRCLSVLCCVDAAASLSDLEGKINIGLNS